VGAKTQDINFVSIISLPYASTNAVSIHYTAVATIYVVLWHKMYQPAGKEDMDESLGTDRYGME
jgi:hypothetical protein